MMVFENNLRLSSQCPKSQSRPNDRAKPDRAHDRSSLARPMQTETHDRASETHRKTSGSARASRTHEKIPHIRL
jgi:hypothetical protein